MPSRPAQRSMQAPLLKTYTVSSLLDALEKAAGAPVVANYLPPLFESEQQYEEFKSRHSRMTS